MHVGAPENAYSWSMDSAAPSPSEPDWSYYDTVSYPLLCTLEIIIFSFLKSAQPKRTSSIIDRYDSSAAYLLESKYA